MKFTTHSRTSYVNFKNQKDYGILKTQMLNKAHLPIFSAFQEMIWSNDVNVEIHYIF